MKIGKQILIEKHFIIISITGAANTCELLENNGPSLIIATCHSRPDRQTTLSHRAKNRYSEQKACTNKIASGNIGTNYYVSVRQACESARYANILFQCVNNYIIVPNNEEHNLPNSTYAK